MKLEGSPTYYVRLRPYYKEFLEKISKLYELNIFTFACRSYAKTVAGSGRIILTLKHFNVNIADKTLNPFVLNEKRKIRLTV